MSKSSNLGLNPILIILNSNMDKMNALKRISAESIAHDMWFFGLAAFGEHTNFTLWDFPEVVCWMRLSHNYDVTFFAAFSAR